MVELSKGLVLLLMVYLVLGVHELGHFWAMRRLGVRVALLALGAPPWIARFPWGGIEVRLGLLPLAAFVQAAPGEEVRLRGFPLREQAMVFLAGPLANFLGALAGAALLGAVLGLPAFFRGVEVLLTFPLVLPGALWQFLSGSAPAEGAGFLGFLREGSQVVGLGFEGVVALFVALNVVLGWFNLLPLLPLDGGQVLWAWARERFGERVLRLEAWILWAGVGFLLATLLVGIGYDLGVFGR